MSTTTGHAARPARGGMRNDPGRHWAGVVPFGPVQDLVAQARAAESAGLAGLTAPQTYGPPFIPLAACAAATDHVGLLAGIAIGLVRSPFETAMAAMDLDRLSGGRFILGLGTSGRAWTEGFFGMPFDRPVARLRETVEVIRLIIRRSHLGELDRFDGEFHRLDFSEFQPLVPPLRTDLPIWIAGNRRRTIRMAAEVAEGVMGHPIWSVRWATQEGLEALRQGLRRGGRARSDVHFHVSQFVAINGDRREAIEDARSTVAFFAGVAMYEDYFAAHGFGEHARRCQAGVQRGDYRGVAHEVPDEMVETFCLCGSADEVRRRFEPLWATADSFTLYPPAYGPPPDKLGHYANAIAETFYG